MSNDKLKGLYLDQIVGKTVKYAEQHWAGEVLLITFTDQTAIFFESDDTDIYVNRYIPLKIAKDAGLITDEEYQFQENELNRKAIARERERDLQGLKARLLDKT